MPQDTKRNPRSVAVSVLKRIEKSGSWANEELSDALDFSGISGPDRGLLTEIVYGVCERRNLLDFYIDCFSNIRRNKISTEVLNILRCGIYQILYMEKIPDSAAVNESVKIATRCGHGGVSGFVNAVLRRVSSQKEHLPKPDKSDPAKYIGTYYSCSEYVSSLLLSQFGFEGACSIMERFYEYSPVTARVNTLKTDRERLISCLLEENVRCEGVFGHDLAVAIERAGKITDLQSFKEGLFYVQDISSQIAASVLGALPGETVVDVCSSPGGKSFFCAMDMQNSGRLYSFDKNTNKAKIVAQGAKRLGIDIICADVCDAQLGKDELFGTADRVLVDAPCSGLGIMGKKPDIRYKEKDEIEGLREIQRRIIGKASEYLKKGGVMVYSTCTINRRENEKIASLFLKENPDFTPEEFEIKVRGKTYSSQGGMITLLPHVHKTDGFFIFKTRKA